MAFFEREEETVTNKDSYRGSEVLFVMCSPWKNLQQKSLALPTAHADITLGPGWYDLLQDSVS